VSIYAQLEDVEDRRGQPIPPEQAHEFEELLDEAEVLLEVVAGDLAARVTAGLTTAERLKLAVTGMVLRAEREMVARQQLFASNRSSSAERAAVGGWLSVKRRERSLAGMSSAAGSVSLADADAALVQPLRPLPLGDSWRRDYGCWEPS
jgi:hypothetical protein